MSDLVDFRLAIMVPPLPRILKTGRDSIWCAHIASEVLDNASILKSVFLICPRNGQSRTYRRLNHAPDVPVNGDNSPVRWMAPEILRKLDNEDDFAWSKEGNMWSLAVTLWEVMTFAERPFSELSDFRFVAFALSETDQLPSKIGKLRVLVSHLNS